MKLILSALVCGMMLMAGASGASARNSQPSYKADPDVYKVIFEDANFRVIRVVRKKGLSDRPRSHLLPSTAYHVNDCKNRLYSADGKFIERDTKGGTSSATPVTASHSVENIGASDCTQIIVEKNRRD